MATSSPGGQTARIQGCGSTCVDRDFGACSKHTGKAAQSHVSPHELREHIYEDTGKDWACGNPCSLFYEELGCELWGLSVEWSLRPPLPNMMGHGRGTSPPHWDLTQLPQGPCWEGTVDEQEVPVVTQPQPGKGPVCCSLPLALHGPPLHPGPP